MGLVVQRARQFSAEMCYDMAVFTHDFGYSSNDVELQILLQMVKHHLGELFLDQLIDLGVRASKMPRDALTESLSQGVCVSNNFPPFYFVFFHPHVFSVLTFS